MINFAFKQMLFVVPCTIAAVGLASPANAFEAPERSASASEVAAVQANVPGAPAAATKKKSSPTVCVSLPPLTGSRMTSRQCKTKAEWQALGYELGEKE